MEQKTEHHWSIEKFYSKSWGLVKKHPVIWLFGLANIVFVGGASFNTVSNLNPQPSSTEIKKMSDTNTMDVKSTEPSELDEERYREIRYKNTGDPRYKPTPEKSSRLKDELPFSFNGDPATQFKNVPAFIYLLLLIEAGALFLIALSIGLVAVAWSQAAIIKVFDAAETKKSLEAETVSRGAFRSIFPIMRYSGLQTIYALGLVLLISFAMVVLFIVYGLFSTFVQSTALSVISFVVGLVALCVAIYYCVKLSTALFWGFYYLVLENTSAREAAKLGWKHSGGTIGKIFKLGLANGLISMIFVVIGYLPMLIFLAIPATPLLRTWQFDIWMIPFFVLGVVVGFPIGMFCQVLVGSVNAGTWYFAFLATKHSKQEMKTL